MQTLARAGALARAALAAFVASVALAAHAWPDKPITLVVPNPAGGAADNLARGFAEEMAKRLKQPVVVENIGGASGALGAQKVLRAPADGYTLIFGNTSDMVVTPIANPSAGYATKDFTPVALVGLTPMALVARPGLGITHIDQLVAQAKARPNGLSVGTTGASSFQAFATMALQKAAGIDLLAVPYKGGAPLTTDLLGGQIDLAVMAMPGAMPHVRSGKLTLLGLLIDKRLPTAPDLPTVNEGSSVKGVNMQIWAGIGGPPGLPATVVEKLNTTVRDILLDKEFNERRIRNGDLPVTPMTSAEFGRFLGTEVDKFRALAAGMKLE
ncbi:MAG: tripartite tricarboxylate transporter substrate binding protein [Burkholderiales bacterium]|nr:tripartite tricarboxylate transporter substrate binding protein [Burkholderiales bacterium]